MQPMDQPATTSPNHQMETVDKHGYIYAHSGELIPKPHTTSTFVVAAELNGNKRKRVCEGLVDNTAGNLCARLRQLCDLCV